MLDRRLGLVDGVAEDGAEDADGLGVVVEREEVGALADGAGVRVRLVASPNKIMTELGWKPTRTNMQDILSSAWEWHQSNGYK